MEAEKVGEGGRPGGMPAGNRVFLTKLTSILLSVVAAGLFGFKGGAKESPVGIDEDDGVETETFEELFGAGTGFIGSIFPWNGSTTVCTASACLLSTAAVPVRGRDW